MTTAPSFTIGYRFPPDASINYSSTASATAAPSRSGTEPGRAPHPRVRGVHP
jgi:hypothetical protein